MGPLESPWPSITLFPSDLLFALSSFIFFLKKTFFYLIHAVFFLGSDRPSELRNFCIFCQCLFKQRKKCTATFYIIELNVLDDHLRKRIQATLKRLGESSRNFDFLLKYLQAVKSALSVKRYSSRLTSGI